MGVDGAPEIAARELPETPGLANPGLSFDNTRKVLGQQAAARLQEGRFYVLLTLSEAEAVRAALHCAAVGGRPLVPEAGGVGAALRSLLPGAEGTQPLAETLVQTTAATRWQRTAAEQCFRFFDSMHDFSEAELDALLNAVQANPPAARRAFFEGVAACRRRRKLDLSRHVGPLSALPFFTPPLLSASRSAYSFPLARLLRPRLRHHPPPCPCPCPPGILLDTPDEFHLLTRRAAIKRVCFALRSRGMLASDAFRVMDRTSRGALTPAELAAGIAWLGVKLSQAQARGAGCLLSRPTTAAPASAHAC